MTINGKEIDFSIANIEHARNMEKALRNMEKEENEIRNMGEVQMSVMLKKMIGVFQNFFSEATGVDVLEDCTDFVKAKEAYSDFLTEIKKQKEQVLAPFSLNRIK